MYEYITIEDVYEGYKDCKRFKASTTGCVEYMQNYLANNLQLYQDLNSMTYEIGQSKAFCVKRPKLREVFCAQFRDRIDSLFGYMKHYNSYAIRWMAWKKIKHKESVYCQNMNKLKIRRNNGKSEFCKNVCA